MLPWGGTLDQEIEGLNPSSPAIISRTNTTPSDIRWGGRFGGSASPGTSDPDEHHWLTRTLLPSGYGN